MNTMPDFVNQTRAEQFRWLENACISVELAKAAEGIFLGVDFIDAEGTYRRVRVCIRYGSDIMLKMCEQVYLWQTQGGYCI